MATQVKKLSIEQEESFAEACAEVREALVSAERGDVLARHKVGVMVLNVRDESKFGEEGVARMEGEFKLDEKTLYRYGRVAEVWSADELSELIARRNAKGLGLCWSHLELLACVEDGRTRRPLIEQALNECLSVRALNAAIKGHGTLAKPPKSNLDTDTGAEARSELTHLLSSMEKEARAVEERVLPMFAAGNTKLTDSELSEFRSSLKSIEAVEGILSSIKSSLERITSEATIAPASPTVQPPKPIRAKRTRKMGAKDQVLMAT